MRIDTGSTFASLPHLAMAGCVPLGGRLADLLLEKQLLSVTNVRYLSGKCCK